MIRHFLTLDDFTKSELLEILDIAKELKRQSKERNFVKYLHDKSVGLIFQQNSTRTRVSFEVAACQLGANVIFLNNSDSQLGRNEPLKDTARVLSKMLDMVVFRTQKHSNLLEFTKFSSIPVINALSSDSHPALALANYMSMEELSITNGVSYIGAGNNIANSWLSLASKMGFDLKIATPDECKLNEKMLTKAYDNAKISGAKITITNNPEEAALNANLITTDCWFSMSEDKDKANLSIFSGFCINKGLMKLANKNAIFLHCLPAYRGYEVEEEIFEKFSKEIFLVSENMIYIQKGIMIWLDKNRGSN